MNHKNIFLLPFIVLSLLFSAYLIFDSHTKLDYIYERSNQLIERQTNLQNSINTMQHAIQERILTLLEMAHTFDAFELDDLRSSLREEAGIFLKARDNIIALAKTPEQLNHYYPVAMREKISDQANKINLAADYFVNGDYAEGMAIVNEYSIPQRLEIIAGVSRIDKLMEEEVNETKQELDREYRSARNHFEIYSILMLLIVLFFTSVIIIRLLSGEQVLQGKLADQKIQYKTIINTVRDGIITMDSEGNISSVNPGIEKIFMVREQDIIDHNITELIDTENLAELKNYISAVHDGIVANSLILTIHRETNTPVTIELQLSKSGIDGTQSLCGVIRDITDQKKAEDEQLRASKLESIGVLAGGIAHDFNNMLVGISGNIEMARATIENKDKSIRHLNSSKKAVFRASTLTQQLLTFAKGGSPIKRNTDLKEIIRESTEFSLHGSNINTRFEIDDDTWLADVDAGQISQMIQNLVINAMQSMPEGGDLFVRCTNSIDTQQDDRAGLHGKYVRIEVQDTGYGISKQAQRSIFDPYFTTKEDGAGLGLALSYSIIKKHNGAILVDSEEGKGSRFTIYLPASSIQQTITKSKAQKQPDDIASTRILLMDDDETILTIAQDMLEQLGHTIITARSGEEAIRKYRESLDNDEPFGLVIMDLTIIGGMGGKQAIKHILEIEPDAKAIVSSGYSNDPVMANHKDYGFSGAMAKPYDLDVLQQSIKQCLG